MQLLVFILSAILIYPILGTIICFILSINKLGNLKFGIVLYTFGFPIINGIVLYLIFSGSFPKDPWLVIVYCLSILIREVLSRNARYLLKLDFIDGQISIKYMNAVFRLKSAEFKISEGYKVSLSNRKTIIDYPATLKISFEENSRAYIIFTKNIWTSTRETLNAANIRFANQEGGTLDQSATDH